MPATAPAAARRVDAPPAGAAPEEGSKAAKLLDALRRGKAPAVAELLDPADPETPDLATQSIVFDGVRGPPICHALFFGRKKAADHILSLEHQHKLVDIDESEAVYFCVRYCRWDMAEFILGKTLLGDDINKQRGTDGNTLLHCVCARPRPHVAFLAQLCRIKELKVNVRNAAGHTAVHLLALHTTGVEGRDAAVLLRNRGARLDAREGGDGGRTPLQMSSNSYLREVLSVVDNSSNRQDPSSLLSAEQRKELDAIAFDFDDGKKKKKGKPKPDKSHAQLDKLLKEADAAKEQLLKEKEESYVKPETGGKKKKKMQVEEVDGLISRLVNGSAERTEETMKRLHKDKEAREIKRSVRRLDKVEQSESTDRLHGAAAEAQERRAELVKKYSPAPGRKNKLYASDLQESVGRLYQQSMEDSKEKRKALDKQYLGAVGKGRWQGAQGKVENPSRMFDEVSAKQQQTLDSIKSKYLAPAREPITRSKKQLEEAFSRLTASK